MMTNMSLDGENTSGPPSPVKKHLLTPAHINKAIEPISITPFKSPHNNKLPPLPSGSTIMPKRRKASNDLLSTPKKADESSFVPVIPHKSRNFSTPLPKRIPSIKETPIPDLTPPTSRAAGDESFNSNLDSPSSPVFMPSPLKNFASLDGLSASELSREEYSIDQETRKLIKQIEKVKQYKAIRDQEKTHDVDNLIAKWRDASQKSSAYLYNELKLKVAKMGGWKEFKKFQRQQQQQQQSSFVDDELLDELYQFKESERFNELNQYERDEIESRIIEEEARVNSVDLVDDEDISDVEINDANDELKEALKYFGVDSEKFKLIYEE